MVGRAPVGGILFTVLVLEHGCQHLHGGESGGEILEELRPLIFHVPHPRGAAGGHQRQVLACLQTAQELLRFLAHGEVRAEDRVVHLVHAHDLERCDKLVEHIFAARDAIGLAERYAHGGGDLNDDALLRVVQRAPRIADLVFHRDGAGRAHGGALAAADAVGARKLLVIARLDVQARTAARKVQDAHALHLLAHAHAVAAENALVIVDLHGGRGVVLGNVLARVAEADMVDAEAHCHLAQAAGAALFAHGAVAAVGREHQLQDHAAVFEQTRGVRADAQAVFRLGRARGRDLAGVKVFDHAHTARAINGEIGMEAEVRHLYACLAAHIQHRRFLVKFHADVVHVHDISHRSPPPEWRRRGRLRCRCSILRTSPDRWRRGT